MVHPTCSTIGKTKQNQSDKVITQIWYFFTILSFFSPQFSKYLIAALQGKFYFIIFSGAKFLSHLSVRNLIPIPDLTLTSCRYAGMCINRGDTVTEDTSMEVTDKATTTTTKGNEIDLNLAYLCIISEEHRCCFRGILEDIYWARIFCFSEIFSWCQGSKPPDGFVIYYDKNAKVLYLCLWFESPNISCTHCAAQYLQQPPQPACSASSWSAHQVGKLCLMQVLLV